MQVINHDYFFCCKSPFAWHQKFEYNLRLEQNDHEIPLVFTRHAVVLLPAAEFASLVVLLCISRGSQFQATENATKSQNTTLKTYG